MKQNKKDQIYIMKEENDINPEKKEELFNKLKEKYSFREIIISELIEDSKKRNILPDKPIDQITTLEKIDLIIKILFLLHS